MPQPPTDWVPFDDRSPADPAPADFTLRSEAFAEDLDSVAAAAARRATAVAGWRASIRGWRRWPAGARRDA